jgi:light-regulated signal transduction histidine kinase (bacteriophytochrome)
MDRTVYDRSEIENREQARLLNEVERLRRENQQLRAFTPLLAHELGNPLRALTLFAELLARRHSGALSAEGKRDIQHICTTARRVRQLTEDLLSYARFGQKPIRKLEVNTTELVRSVIEQLECEYPSRTVEFRVGSLPPCQADVTLLRQVFLNLLRNSVKFSLKRERPIITVDALTSGDPVIYGVSDNGVGFDMQNADRLFHPFERLHGRDEYEGSGVGLVIVREIVERHGGRVWAEGKPDEGATFSFTLG